MINVNGVAFELKMIGDEVTEAYGRNKYVKKNVHMLKSVYVVTSMCLFGYVCCYNKALMRIAGVLYKILLHRLVYVHTR